MQFINLSYGIKFDKFYFSCLLFLIFCKGFSQTSYTDSLLSVLKITKEDTIRINVLNNLFVDYEYVDGEKAKKYLDEAFELAEKVDYRRGLGNSYMYFQVNCVS